MAPTPVGNAVHMPDTRTAAFDASDPDLPVILLSHRAPITFAKNDAGERIVNRGAGGLVTALTGLTEQFADTVWVCAADG